MRQIVERVVDDVDGRSPADETVRFGLDGVEYEIDVTGKHADELRSAFASYITAGRRLGRSSSAVSRRPSSAPGVQAVREARERRATIREWATRRGIALNGAGRLPDAVVRDYEEWERTQG